MYLAKFSCDNAYHSAIKRTPFEAGYGLSPFTPAKLLFQPVDPANRNDIVQRIHDTYALITEE